MNALTHAKSPPLEEGALLIPRVFPQNPFTPFAKADIHQSIGARFEQQVRAHASRLAVKTMRAELSYAELNASANRVARAILAACPSSTQPVALFMEQDAASIAAILGVLKTGRPYVPLDLSFGAGRNRAMLEDAQADLLITDRASSLHARELAVGQVRVLNCEDIASSLSGENVGVEASPDAVAYILYTSGSTGQPKGVFQNHRNVLHNTLKTTNGLHISSSDRLTLLASCAFAASVSDLFGSLLNGAALFPFNLREQGLSKLADWLIEQEITVYHSVPTVYRRFISTLRGDENFSRIRLLKVGGEPVLRRDHELYKQHFPARCTFHVNLGSTEMNVVRQFFATHETKFEGSTLPIGYEVDDTQVLLIDEVGNEVGFRREGELVIRSPYLACGYWRKPELTKAAFQTDPRDSSVRTYRIGDLGYMLPDGCLYHLGRKDFQVKIRGYRVEVAEVESVLQKAAGVKEAVVVGRDTRGGDKRLVAYIISDRKSQATPGELRNFLVQGLPDYMVPSAFVFLDALPLTSTGKIDRNALPAPKSGRPETGPAFQAPRNGIETMVAQLYAEVLDVDPVGIHDDFIDLGGDSLAAMQLIAAVSQSFGVELPVRALLESRSVASLAKQIDERKKGMPKGPGETRGKWSFLVPIQPMGDHKPLFLVPGGGGGEIEFFLYARLARRVGLDYPCYVLMAQGSDRGQQPHTTAQEMANDYVEEIRSFQPEGPYFVAGECYGGILAFEIACQLRSQGERVALLALLDTYNPCFTRRVRLRTRRFFRAVASRWRGYVVERIRRHKENMRNLSGWQRARYALEKSAKIPLAVGYATRLKKTPDPTGVRQWDESQRRARLSYTGKLVRHAPGTFDGCLTLLLSEELYGRGIERDWRRCVRDGVEVIRLRGDHNSYIREHNGVAAAELRRCLEQARMKTKGGV